MPDLEATRVAHACIAMSEMLQREQHFLRGSSSSHAVRMHAESRILFSLARYLTGADLTQVRSAHTRFLQGPSASFALHSSRWHTELDDGLAVAGGGQAGSALLALVYA